MSALEKEVWIDACCTQQFVWETLGVNPTRSSWNSTYMSDSLYKEWKADTEDLIDLYYDCLTAFLQTTLLFLGLLTWTDNMLLAIGIMMAASEVPRIAERFGLDTSVKFNMMSAVHMTSTAVNLAKNIAK